MKITFPKTNMFTPTPAERFQNSPVVVLLLCTALLMIGAFAEGLVISAVMSFLPSEATVAVQVLIQLFATAIPAALVILWCRLGERRSLVRLGFSPRGAAGEYALGAAGGVVLFALGVGLCTALGTATVSHPTGVSVGLILLYLVAFLIQGLSEELICRVYLMVSLSRSFPIAVCVVSNALFFSLLHLGNPGISALALLNIFLFGILASLLTLRRGSIWMAAALHSLWNFAQGNVFGIMVSGQNGIPSLLTTALHEDTPGQTLINGGAFGLEGGLAITGVLVVAIVVVALMGTKRDEVGQKPGE